MIQIFLDDTLFCDMRSPKVFYNIKGLDENLQHSLLILIILNSILCNNIAN